eukprot:2493058-Pyramimonas_sp.AAC.1
MLHVATFVTCTTLHRWVPLTAGVTARHTRRRAARTNPLSHRITAVERSRACDLLAAEAAIRNAEIATQSLQDFKETCIQPSL